MTNTPWLDPMPDMELMGSPLDLGRPELAPLMERYGSARPHEATTLLDPPTALVVTHRPGEETPLRAVLEEDGWAVLTCEGPGVGACPVMRGERCPLRELADAAIVFVEPPRRANAASEMPRLRCAADSSSPGVVALEGRLDLPRFSGTVATVGALRGPAEILRTVTALLGSQEAAEG